MNSKSKLQSWADQSLWGSGGGEFLRVARVVAAARERLRVRTDGTDECEPKDRLTNWFDPKFSPTKIRCWVHSIDPQYRERRSISCGAAALHLDTDLRIHSELSLLAVEVIESHLYCGDRQPRRRPRQE